MVWDHFKELSFIPSPIGTEVEVQQVHENTSSPPILTYKSNSFHSYVNSADVASCLPSQEIVAEYYPASDEKVVHELYSGQFLRSAQIGPRTSSYIIKVSLSKKDGTRLNLVGSFISNVKVQEMMPDSWDDKVAPISLGYFVGTSEKKESSQLLAMRASNTEFTFFQ